MDASASAQRRTAQHCAFLPPCRVPNAPSLIIPPHTHTSHHPTHNTPRARATVLPDAKYAASHEWAKIEGDVATFGISDHAQAELGDVVYVELPEVGAAVTKGETFGCIESVKVRLCMCVCA